VEWGYRLIYYFIDGRAVWMLLFDIQLSMREGRGGYYFCTIMYGRMVEGGLLIGLQLLMRGATVCTISVICF